MSKRTNGGIVRHRRFTKDDDIAAYRYELPGFTAGMVRSEILEVLEIIEVHEQQHGANAFTQYLKRILASTEQHARDWQQYAATVTDYRWAREQWQRERQLEEDSIA